MAREDRWRPPGRDVIQALSTTPAHSDEDIVSETAVEVLARLEAIQANSSYALLGLLPKDDVLAGNVVMAAQAAVWARAAA